MGNAPSFFNLFFAILPLFMLGVLGVYFRKYGGMSIHADETILWLLINLFTPCLIVDSFLGNKALERIGDVLIAPILGFITVIIGILLARCTGKYIGLHKNEEKRTFALCIALYNYGYIPIPIILLFFNKEVLGMLFMFNVGLELAMWTLGFMTLTGRASFYESMKRAVNPPLVAVVFSLIINAWCMGNPLPPSLARVIHMIGQAAIPMALLVVGATVYDHFPSIRTFRPIAPVLAGIILRLFVIPITFIAMAFLLPISGDLKTVLCIQAGSDFAPQVVLLSKRM